MSLVMNNFGEVVALEALVGKTAAPIDLRLRLYSNDVSLTDTNAIGDFTETSGGGYAEKALTGTSWNAAISGDPSSISYAQQAFVFTGPTDITDVYGYMVVDIVPATAEVLWAERFVGAPFSVTTNGDEIRITPKVEAS